MKLRDILTESAEEILNEVSDAAAAEDYLDDYKDDESFENVKIKKNVSFNKDMKLRVATATKTWPTGAPVTKSIGSKTKIVTFKAGEEVSAITYEGDGDAQLAIVRNGKWYFYGNGNALRLMKSGLK